MKMLMTSVKLQKLLHLKLQQRIISDGYGMRGKSKWIIEAVERFLMLPDYPALVDIADNMEELADVLSIRMPEDLVQRIDKAIVNVRKQYPMIEGVKSNLLRASILQRLLQDRTSVTEVDIK